MRTFKNQLLSEAKGISMNFKVIRTELKKEKKKKTEERDTLGMLEKTEQVAYLKVNRKSHFPTSTSHSPHPVTKCEIYTRDLDIHFYCVEAAF